MRHPKPYRLYRRETGYYFYKLPDGKWKTTGKKELTEAHAVANDALQGKPGPTPQAGPGARSSAPGRTPLKDYAIPAFERYVEAKRSAAGGKGRQLSEAYVDSTRGYLKRFLPEDPLGQIALGRITADDFQDFQLRLLEEKLPDHRTTAVRVLEAVRLILRRAEKLGHIPRSPDRAVDVAQDDSRQRGIYTDAELEVLFPAVVWEKGDFAPWIDAMDYTAAIVAASTGMRRGEILALAWDAVHLQEGREYLEIRGSMADSGKIGPTKGRRPRATPIFDFVLWPDRRAVKALKELRKRAEAASRIIGMDRVPILEGPVFSIYPGHRYGTTWWAKRFRAALEGAKIERGRGEGLLPADAHTLRHSLASRLKAAGLPDDLVRRFCGWSSLNVQDRYTHLGPDVFARVMELVRATS